MKSAAEKLKVELDGKKTLADLVGQVGLVAPDQGLRAAAGAAQSQLMRDVVAAGALPASAIAQAGPP